GMLSQIILNSLNLYVLEIGMYVLIYSGIGITPVSLRNPSGDSSLICSNFINIIPIKIKSLTN
ncbi:hypothetical protein, partial [Allofrancisella guangzhouensis]|uniref:hypothetical protein n=1 Tax=Allofrancisella guangzhouensis TaxID=594679 RepID=UPI001F321DB1